MARRGLEEQEAHAGTTARVLVIDDDEHILALLGEVLGMEGYEVVGAIDGIDAIGALRRSRPDVILLDLMMPRVSGWGFTERYAREPGPHAPIIVLTAVASQVVRMPEQGVARIVPKPFSVDALLRHVERAVTHRA
jgi:two-component system response regulator MprA